MKPKHITINEIIQEKNYKNYLEVGVANGANFHRIRCEQKTGCDPTLPDSFTDRGGSILFKGTSDEFFAQLDEGTKYDIIFIDGFHEADQVERDILNSWTFLKKTGTIILHDVLPYTKEMQEVPRKQSQWTGDVWRAYQGFKETYPKIKCIDIEEKYGLGTIIKDSHKIKPGFVNKEMTYEEFKTL